MPETMIKTKDEAEKTNSKGRLKQYAIPTNKAGKNTEKLNKATK